ncbi:hypothetical protein BH09PSE6_BH09PSE6_04880 [soil metagenome]
MTRSKSVRLDRLLTQLAAVGCLLALAVVLIRLHSAHDEAAALEVHLTEIGHEQLRLAQAVAAGQPDAAAQPRLASALGAGSMMTVIWRESPGGQRRERYRGNPDLPQAWLDAANAGTVRVTKPTLAAFGSGLFEQPVAVLLDEPVAGSRDRLIALWDLRAVRDGWMASWWRALIIFAVFVPTFVVVTSAILKRPLRRLREAVRFAQGLGDQQSGRLAEGGSGVAEIEALRASLNLAADTLYRQGAQVHASEAKFYAAIDELPETVFQIDAELNWVFLSAAWERHYGHAVRPTLSQRASQNFALSERERIDHGLTQLLSGAADQFRDEAHLVNARGDVVGVEFIARPYADAAGRIIGVTGSIALLDSRRELERALAAQRRRLQEVVDSLPMSIVLKTTGGEIVLANARAAVAYGRPLSQLIGLREGLLIDGRHALNARERERRAMSTRSAVIDEESDMVDGRQRTLLVGTVPIDDGARPLLLAFALDISERKRIEEELRRQREFVSLVLDSDPSFIFVKDEQRRYALLNRAFLEFTGKPASALLGRRVEEVLGDADEYLQPMTAELRVLETQQEDVQEEWAWSSEGERRWFISMRKPMITGDGRLFILVIQQDITERRRYEADLVGARLRAEEASRAKSEFLANMSHEIRTPMNGILGMNDLLMTTALNEQQRQYLGLARSSANALLGVIGELLDFSKIEAGKMVIEHIAFNLDALVAEVAKPMAVQAHEKGLDLQVRVAPDLPQRLVGDPGRLRQVLTNLLGNAVKFTEAGEVVIAVEPGWASPDQVPGGPATLRFTVRDTGIGIVPEKLETIFEPFTQADGSTTRRYGGTGLGLTISSRLVALMGGRIAVQSEPGQGSRFSFELSLGVDAGTAPRTRHPQCRALWVAPSGEEAAWHAQVLAHWGVASVAARDCAAARESLAQGKFDLVFIDERVIDGQAVALVEEVRTHAPNALIVMLTNARAEQTDDLDDSLLASASGSALRRVVKPASLDEVHDLIGAAARRELLPGPTTTTNPDPLAGGLHILLAEDNVINQIVATNLLEQFGHVITVVGNGREALDALERDDFDLVLMDVQMPEMGGFEATAALRERERASGKAPMPVIAVTAHAMRGDRERCIAAGMNGYISKPFQPPTLVAEIERVLAETGIADKDEAAGSRPGTFSRAAALAAMNHDETLLARVAELFVRNMPDLRARMLAASRSGDANQLRRIAHEIKGMGMNVGAVELGRVASVIEQAALRLDIEAAAREVDTLMHELQSVGRIMQTVTETPEAGLL